MPGSPPGVAEGSSTQAGAPSAANVPPEHAEIAKFVAAFGRVDSVVAEAVREFGGKHYTKRRTVTAATYVDLVAFTAP